MKEASLFSPDLPLGFGMALAQNTTALQRFCDLSHEEQKAMIDRARSVESAEEMRAFVDNLNGESS